jgi:hypothetical protein
MDAHRAMLMSVAMKSADHHAADADHDFGAATAP